jgi:hypothetical protein
LDQIVQFAEKAIQVQGESTSEYDNLAVALYRYPSDTNACKYFKRIMSGKPLKMPDVANYEQSHAVTIAFKLFHAGQKVSCKEKVMKEVDGVMKETVETTSINAAKLMTALWPSDMQEEVIKAYGHIDKNAHVTPPPKKKKKSSDEVVDEDAPETARYSKLEGAPKPVDLNNMTNRERLLCELIQHWKQTLPQPIVAFTRNLLNHLLRISLLLPTYPIIIQDKELTTKNPNDFVTQFAWAFIAVFFRRDPSLVGKEQDSQVPHTAYMNYMRVVMMWLIYNAELWND